MEPFCIPGLVTRTEHHELQRKYHSTHIHMSPNTTAYEFVVVQWILRKSGSRELEETAKTDAYVCRRHALASSEHQISP